MPLGDSQSESVRTCLPEQTAGSTAIISGSSRYLVTHNSCSEQLT